MKDQGSLCMCHGLILIVRNEHISEFITNCGRVSASPDDVGKKQTDKKKTPFK